MLIEQLQQRGFPRRPVDGLALAVGNARAALTVNERRVRPRRWHYTCFTTNHSKSPCLALPCRAMPRRAAPCRASPRLLLLHQKPRQIILRALIPVIHEPV